MTTRILGTGSCFPSTIITNVELSKIVDTNDEWISTRTGIKERRISTGETASQLASGAAQLAIANAQIKPEEIDIIIVATSSSDYIFPNAASIVQAEIGAIHAVCYDLSAACSGFIFALNTAHAFIKAGIYKKALIIGTEIMSKQLNWEDRGTCVLFGDGAGAAVVGASDTGIEEFVMHSDGTRGMVLTCGESKVDNFLIRQNENNNTDQYITMQGQEVFKFAVKKVPESIIEVLEKADTDIHDIKYFVLHQANIRIIQYVAKSLKIDIDKFPMNLERFGNTSAASVPIILDEINKKGMLHRGDKIVLSGFGAGLSWGSTLITW